MTTARAIPLGLLLLFAFAIRGLPALSRPASPPDDCEHVRDAGVHGPNVEAGVTGNIAVAAMERCLGLRPDDIELMVDLAAAYDAAGRRDRAEDLYTRALAVDPRDGEVRAALDALRKTEIRR